VQDGVTGLLGPCDAVELAARAARLLTDEPLRREMGLRARAWTERRFGPDRLASDIAAIYTSIAEERGWWPAREKEEAR
jgi:glycosyltransferase involved in cell wall biosynthesis